MKLLTDKQLRELVGSKKLSSITIDQLIDNLQISRKKNKKLMNAIKQTKKIVKICMENSGQLMLHTLSKSILDALKVQKN